MREYRKKNIDTFREKDRERYPQRKAAKTIEQRQADAKRQALYRERHPERIAAYKQRPKTKAKAAARTQRLRAKWSPERKEQAKADFRRWHLKNLYGITPEQFDAMYTAQGGVCEICRSAERSSRGRFNRLHVDHCHLTGQVRGLLCTSCNATLGRIDENPMIARSIADYIEKYQVSVVP